MISVYFREKGITNLTVYTGDVSVFTNEEFEAKFDRIISIGEENVNGTVLRNILQVYCMLFSREVKMSILKLCHPVTIFAILLSNVTARIAQCLNCLERNKSN